ncbi:MAG: AraC family transcriptional regulator [Nocardioidaceae bacterium]|nr:AraC family transcriptional regulator [Nocardioidaceae bacterium]
MEPATPQHAIKQEFGLGPKQLARVARLQRARALLVRGASLSLVAAQSSYADQAHLPRDWREMTGYSPKEWLREEFPFLQDADAPG